MTNPISPDDVFIEIPEKIIESFNKVISESWDGKEARFTLDHVVSIAESKGIDKSEVFKLNWFDIEEIYRDVGWIVLFEKGDDNDPSIFVFKKPKVRLSAYGEMIETLSSVG